MNLGDWDWSDPIPFISEHMLDAIEFEWLQRERSNPYEMIRNAEFNVLARLRNPHTFDERGVIQTEADLRSDWFHRSSMANVDLPVQAPTKLIYCDLLARPEGLEFPIPRFVVSFYSIP